MKTIKQYQRMDELDTNARCNSCGQFSVKPENVWIDNSGYGYSTRLCKCPKCRKIVILGYIEDYGFDVNNDGRYYE